MLLTLGRRAAVILHDLLMAALAWGIATLLRADFSNTQIWQTMLAALPWVVVAQGLVLWWVGVYRGMWRFASVPDLWNIIRGAVLGTLAVGLALFMVNRLEGVPRLALLLYPFILVLLLSSPRLLYRIWRDHSFTFAVTGQIRKRVLVLGAGYTAEKLVRDLLRDNTYLVLGFLDDNPRFLGGKIHDQPVLGTLDDLPAIAKLKRAELLMIAVPSATSAQMQRIVELCEQTGVDFRTLPRLQALVAGETPLAALREVSISDLLNREPVTLDWDGITTGLRGQTVLVTGSGGSIGAELCRQIARLEVSSLVLYENSEFNLYRIENELRATFPGLVLHARLCDVCDPAAVEHVFTTHRPDIVFHAAAYKHVPMLEAQVREAVHNNVIGTRTVARAASDQGCHTFVLISSDKAVNPANVMGASKRVAEIVCQKLSQQSTTRFITVRFGNVLASTGSVVPLFQSQIAGGGPVTVTHPEITRYFMTIPEACQLIMQAAVMGQGGEIFVLNMGSPVRITYLAEQMIRLSGKVPGKDIEIIYTGLRPGEKLYEELFHAEENLAATSHGKILLAQQRNSDVREVTEVLDKMERACANFDETELRQLIQRLVPEFDETPPKKSSNIIKFSAAKA